MGSKDPSTPGEYNVGVEDLGSSMEDTAQEATELDRQQALLNTLGQERKDIILTIERIDAGTYGKCATCRSAINDARLEAIPTALRCLPCVDKNK